MGRFRLKERWITGRDRCLLCFIQSSAALRVWFCFVSICKHVSWLHSPPLWSHPLMLEMFCRIHCFYKWNPHWSLCWGKDEAHLEARSCCLRSSVCGINDADSRQLRVLGCVAATYSVKHTEKKNKTAGRHQNPADSERSVIIVSRAGAWKWCRRPGLKGGKVELWWGDQLRVPIIALIMQYAQLCL